LAVYSNTLTADLFKLEITTGENFASIVAAIAAKGINRETTIEIKDDFFTRHMSQWAWTT